MSYLISIVIPVYNEKDYLKNCLDSIIKVTKSKLFDTEIVVVDNGSLDNSAEIAERYTDTVYSISRGSISAARNFGVKQSSGSLIVFVDADVRLTEEWADTLEANLDNLLTNSILTGARYIVRDDSPSWIETNWFKPLSQKTADYVNGGNIIISRASFDKVSGFDELLETGEDYEFSMRAKRKNVDVILDSRYKAIHDGYPSTIKDFVRREIWHGKGDFLNLRTMFSSKVAITATVFGLLHITLLLSVFMQPVVWSVIELSMILLMVLIMSFKIFRMHGFLVIIRNIPLSYLYLLARFISLTKVLQDKMRT